MAQTPGRWRALTLLAAAELLGMALWFSGSAVVPALDREWNLTDSQVSWIAIAVQLGFVAGTLLSATLNLPDIVATRHLFAVSAFLGAAVHQVFTLATTQGEGESYVPALARGLGKVNGIRLGPSD